MAKVIKTAVFSKLKLKKKMAEIPFYKVFQPFLCYQPVAFNPPEIAEVIIKS